MLHSKICQNFISSTFICLYNWIHFHSFMFMMIDLKFHWRCSLIENHNQNIIHLSNRQKLRNPIEIFIEAWITHSQRSSFVGVIIQWWHCKRILFLIYQYFSMNQKVSIQQRFIKIFQRKKETCVENSPSLWMKNKVVSEVDHSCLFGVLWWSIIIQIWWESVSKK